MTKEDKKTDNIYVALCKFQAAVPTVEKKRKGFNFVYADLSDIWSAIRKPLTDNGLSLIQLVQNEDGRNYIITKLYHISGECIESRTLIEFTAKKFQEVGSAITYYRRYALSSMLGIVSDQDVDDKIEKQEEIYQKAKTEKITQQQLEIIEKLINGFDFIRPRLIRTYGSLANINAADYKSVVTAIKKLIMDHEAKNENN